MRRAGISLLGGITLCAATVLISASASASSNGIHATVKPTTGSPRTRFHVSFTAPESSGVSGSTWRDDEVSAAGPARRGCDWTASAPAGSVHAGERVHVALAPAGPVREWCEGTFSGSVDETLTPVCGFREVCPAYVAVVTLGRFSFRVQGLAAARG